MKFDIIIRTQSAGETRYTVTGKDYIDAMGKVGYYLAGMNVRQVLITKQEEVARILKIVDNEEKE